MKTMLLTAMTILTASILGASDIVRLTPEQVERAGIRTATLQERAFTSRVRAVGEVTRSPGSTLTVKTIAAGRVESIGVAPGDRVARGQILLTLHSHELLSLQTDLLMALDDVRLSEQRVEAGRELVTFDGISRLELERRQQQALSARLRADTLREEIVDHGFPAARLEKVVTNEKLDPHLPVAAPVEGVVLEVIVQDQEWVQAYAPLLVVGDPDRVELELQISPDQASSIEVGDTVVFQPVGQRGVSGDATVITRVPQIDPATRTVRLRARIDTCAGACFPGAFVEATVRHGSSRTSLAVPVSAVISVSGGDSVFVAVGRHEFEARAVRLGPRDDDVYEVLGGLGEGDTIAISGVFFLKSALVKGEGGEE
jgi:RND family efflux transporter MFP subunit